MKYITSCPKCETNFLLNDALIKAHRGKVQCGSCELVFNAKTRLTEVDDDITSAEEYQAIVEEHERDETEEITLTTTPDYQRENNETSGSFIGEFSPDTTASAESDPALEIITTPIVDDFMNKRKPSKIPSKPSTTILLSILSLLLILSASIQSIYHLRVKIAAEYPQFKPLLVKACAQLNCTIDLPKELDLITIGDADMQEDDNYQSVINFTSSITNNANYPQAYPNIELTLTNTDDKVIIKKLILPKDYLSSDQKAEDGLPAHEVKTIKLPLYVDKTSVAGYRILLVY